MNGQLDITGRESMPETPPPVAYDAPRLFDAPSTIRGQMALQAPADTEWDKT